MKRIGIIAFAFGLPETEPNKLIGLLASRTAEAFDTPIFTQHHISITKGIDFDLADEIPENPLPTLVIARQAITWAIKRGLNELIIIAARPHIERCKRDIEFLINENHLSITVTKDRRINIYRDPCWFTSESKQFRARNIRYWYLREWILMRMPFWLYKIVAG